MTIKSDSNNTTTHVSKQIVTETAHRLMNHSGACRNVHGHSYVWVLTLCAKRLNNNGMVVDFKEIKQLMVACIHNIYDHALVLNKKDPLLDIFKEHNVKVVTMPTDPTAEAMCFSVFNAIQKEMDTRWPVKDFDIQSISVFETETSCAKYTLEDG